MISLLTLKRISNPDMLETFEGRFTIISSSTKRGQSPTLVIDSSGLDQLSKLCEFKFT